MMIIIVILIRRVRVHSEHLASSETCNLQPRPLHHWAEELHKAWGGFNDNDNYFYIRLWDFKMCSRSGAWSKEAYGARYYRCPSEHRHHINIYHHSSTSLSLLCLSFSSPANLIPVNGWPVKVPQLLDTNLPVCTFCNYIPNIITLTDNIMTM